MREFRFKFTGTLFCIVIVTNLLFTTQASNLIKKIPHNLKEINYDYTDRKSSKKSTSDEKNIKLLELSQKSLYQNAAEGNSQQPKILGGAAPFIIPIIPVILTLSILLFTSDAIGYAISSIVVLYYERAHFRWCDTYLTRLRQLNKRYGQQVKKRYFHLDPIQLEKEYNEDVIHSYLWQCGSIPLIEWCVRRDSAFLTATSASLGILLGLILSLGFIHLFGLTWCGYNWVVSVISIFFTIIFYLNGRFAFNEYWQMINLWYLEH